MTHCLFCSARRPSLAVVLTLLTGCWIASTVSRGTAQAQETAPQAASPETRHVIAGEIRELGDHSLTLSTDQDQTQQIQISGESRITLNGRPVSLKELEAGDRVTVRMQSRQTHTAARVRAFRPVAEGETPAERERAAIPAVPAAVLGAVIIRTPEGEVGVWRVAPRGPAAQAGLQPGDQLLEIDDQEIATPGDLFRVMAQKRPGDAIHIVFSRDDQEHSVRATLMRPEELLSALRQEWQERRSARRERAEAREELAEEPWLGLVLGEAKEGGVSVARVLPNSPAAQAGIEVGDVLRQLGTQKVDSAEAANQALQKQKPGDKIPLEITRNGKEETHEVTVAERERPREELRRLRAERPGRGSDEERIEGMLRDLKKDLQDLRQQVQDLARKSSESKQR